VNIYVGNLSRQTTEDELRAEFEAFGVVTTVSVIKDKFTGEARGFGFVEMANVEEAKKAMEGLNGKELGGRTLNINEARPREDKPRGGGGGYGGGGGGGYRGGGDRGGRSRY
jgi:RNA recognition motif-containing protein